MHQPIETLSKGYRRRVGVAQALLHDPPVLILDEPTDGLDPNQKHEMRGIIAAMAPEKAIIISTHLLEEVEAVCSRAIIIARGRILLDGTPAELAARSRYHNAVRLGIAARRRRADPGRAREAARRRRGRGGRGRRGPRAAGLSRAASARSRPRSPSWRAPQNWRLTDAAGRARPARRRVPRDHRAGAGRAPRRALACSAADAQYRHHLPPRAGRAISRRRSPMCSSSSFWCWPGC